MAQITAALVKELREMTNAPMMECKKALVATDGDIEAAVDELRKIGVAKAVKRAGRDTNEGTIAAYVAEDGKTGALLELTCETDFVGTNPKFTGFANDLARVVAENDPADVDALMACAMGSSTVADELTEMIHVIGENMRIIRFKRMQTEGALSGYVHLGGKLADIASFGFAKAETADNAEFVAFAHDVAMQVVASAPVAARRDEVPADIIEHEKEIYRAQAAESGRPEKFWDGIVNGRLNKYFAESVLSEQVFIKDPNVKIADLAKAVGKACDDEIVIEGFTRFAFGE